MIFHNKKILTNEAQTELGIVPQKVFDYEQHLAALRLRVQRMIAAMPSDLATYNAIQGYLHFSPVSYDPAEMLEDIVQSAQMTAFITDLRHSWQDVNRTEMEDYYQALEEADSKVFGGVTPVYSQGILKEKLETTTLTVFLEVLSQYN